MIVPVRVQFDDEEDEALAAAVALPWWRRWHWLLALVLPLTISALVLAAGITVRILYPQPVRLCRWSLDQIPLSHALAPVHNSIV